MKKSIRINGKLYNWFEIDAAAAKKYMEIEKQINKLKNKISLLEQEQYQLVADTRQRFIKKPGGVIKWLIFLKVPNQRMNLNFMD